jgi:hypothetical protein
MIVRTMKAYLYKGRQLLYLVIYWPLRALHSCRTYYGSLSIAKYVNLEVLARLLFLSPIFAGHEDEQSPA